MPVAITQYVTIKGLDEIEKTGEFVGQDFVAIKDSVDEVVAYGKPTAQRLRTVVTCDSDRCVNGKINEDLVTVPTVISFDDDGTGGEKFIKEVQNIVIVADYAGNKSVYCCPECAAGAIRKKNKISNVIQFPAGKGTKTFPENGKEK
jgi:hypothetical protein